MNSLFRISRSQLVSKRGFADFGKMYIDPCNGWSFGDLFRPQKSSKENLAKVTDMSIHGLDISSVLTALGNMRNPSSSQSNVSSLGRWKKTSEAHALSRKYT